MFSRSLPSGSPTTINIPIFLAPAFAKGAPTSSASASSRSFTSTAHPLLKQNRDKNKKRGVSAIRRTGPKHPLVMSKYPLPRPVQNPEARSAFPTDENHGLWGFFNEAKEPMMEPQRESSHGRAWTYQELSVKSFDDLHKLFWVCVKEQNQVLTRRKEWERVRAGYGEVEYDEKVKAVRKTMSRIQSVLVDRYHNWQEASIVLQKRSLRELFDESDDQNFEESVDDGTPSGVSVREVQSV